jgi:hypothetical protein
MISWIVMNNGCVAPYQSVADDLNGHYGTVCMVDKISERRISLQQRVGGPRALLAIEQRGVSCRRQGEPIDVILGIASAVVPKQ